MAAKKDEYKLLELLYTQYVINKLLFILLYFAIFSVRICSKHETRYNNSQANNSNCKDNDSDYDNSNISIIKNYNSIYDKLKKQCKIE